MQAKEATVAHVALLTEDHRILVLGGWAPLSLSLIVSNELESYTKWEHDGWLIRCRLAVVQCFNCIKKQRDIERFQITRNRKDDTWRTNEMLLNTAKIIQLINWELDNSQDPNFVSYEWQQEFVFFIGIFPKLFRQGFSPMYALRLDFLWAQPSDQKALALSSV